MAPTGKRARKLASSATSSRAKTTTISKPNSSTAAGPQTLKPLLPLSKPPVFNIGSSVLAFGKDSSKGKGKAKEIGPPNDADEVEDEAQLWVDLYEPSIEDDLAVHKRKVEDVRRWLLEAFDGGPNGKLKKYRRILALTGPAGSAKTTTVRILAREIGAEIIEWKNSVDDSFAGVGEDYGRESLNQKFTAFLKRAASCRPLLLNAAHQSSSALPSSSSRSQTPSALPASRRRIVLLEDLPNILHQPTQEAFHAALDAYATAPPGQVGTPLVIVMSDAGVRAEGRGDGQSGFGYGRGKDAMDVRTAIPPRLLNGAYVTQISFNPIAPTLMIRALQAILSKHASLTKSTRQQQRMPAKNELEVIVEAANGDIRSAVMSLQFACVHDGVHDARGGKGGSKGKKKAARNASAVLESVTRRENSLALFHLLGKVLYNKRKGDPPGQSATARDKQRERDLDARLNTPPPLPDWMKDHRRKPSRVDVDTLYADTPVDASLFSLYIHQNYTQYCSELEECGELCDWLSWIDSSGGENWHQANPHQFHLLTLGTLHSLPTPVARKGQKMYKPEFFDVLKRTKDAAEAVEDVGYWLRRSAKVGRESKDGEGSHRRIGDDEKEECLVCSSWTREEIVMEVGAVLRTREQIVTALAGLDPPPTSHRFFTSLVFTSKISSTQSLDDGDVGIDGEEVDVTPAPRTEYHYRRPGKGDPAESADDGAGGGWLEEDDIEDI